MGGEQLVLCFMELYFLNTPGGRLPRDRDFIKLKRVNETIWELDGPYFLEKGHVTLIQFTDSCKKTYGWSQEKTWGLRLYRQVKGSIGKDLEALFTL